MKKSFLLLLTIPLQLQGEMQDASEIKTSNALEYNDQKTAKMDLQNNPIISAHQEEEHLLKFAEEKERAYVDLETTQKNEEEALLKLIQLEQKFEFQEQTKNEFSPSEVSSESLECSEDSQKYEMITEFDLDKNNVQIQDFLKERIEILEARCQNAENRIYTELMKQKIQTQQQLSTSQMEINETQFRIEQLEQLLEPVYSEEWSCPDNQSIECIYVPNCQNWTANLNFLYWKAEMTENDYAFFQKNNQVALIGGVTPALNGLLGYLQNQTFEWRPGFRIEAGYSLAENLWDLVADYTYYYSSGRDFLVAPNASFDPTDVPLINPTFETDVTIIRSLENNNALHYHVADLAFVKTFPIGQYVCLSCLAGVTGAFIHEKMNVDIVAIDNSVSFHRWNWKFKGAGIKFGIDSAWYLTRGFHFLFGSFFSSLYGYYNQHYTSISIYNPLTPLTPPSAIGNDFDETVHRSIYSLQTLGGLGWDFIIKGVNVGIALQYEFNAWFDLNKRYISIRFNENNDNKRRISNTSNLNLQGLTLSVNMLF